MRGVTQGLEQGLCGQGNAPVAPNGDLHGETAAFLPCATGARTGRGDPKCLAKGSESLAQQGGRAARNTNPQLFLLQPMPRGIGPGQLGAKAHAFPRGAAETTQNIPLRTVGSKRNMTNRAAMRRKYCLNLYWNPFSNQANNLDTPGRLKDTVCISMESKGSFTMKSNEQMHQCHLVRNQPTGEKTRDTVSLAAFLMPWLLF